MGPNGPASTAGIPGLGEVFAGAYRVNSVLGRGAMGIVVAAEHVSLCRRVAVKFLLPGAMRLPWASKRFLREARAAAAIRSEHVARIIDVGVSESGLPYLVMEHLKGSDMQGVLDLRGSFSVTEAVDYVLQACEPIAKAHALGIVHRDLKPSNLFLATDADGVPIVKVLDFGLSKALGALGAEMEAEDGGLTSEALVLGSPCYMSPEQVRSAGSVDQRTDVWALGVILYQFLTERLPFEAPSVPALFAAIAADPPVPPRAHRRSLPAELEAIILRCLEKDVQRRVQSVAELARALMPFGSKMSRREAERIARIARKRVGPPVSRPLSRRTLRRRAEVDPQAATVAAPLTSAAGNVASAQPAPRPRAAASDDGPTLVSGAPRPRTAASDDGPTLVSRTTKPPTATVRPLQAPLPARSTPSPRISAPPPRRSNAPPTNAPPTSAPPTSAPPTSAPLTKAPLTKKSGVPAITSTLIRRRRRRGAATLLALAFVLITASTLAATLWPRGVPTDVPPEPLPTAPPVASPLAAAPPSPDSLAVPVNPPAAPKTEAKPAIVDPTVKRSTRTHTTPEVTGKVVLGPKQPSIRDKTPQTPQAPQTPSDELLDR